MRISNKLCVAIVIGWLPQPSYGAPSCAVAYEEGQTFVRGPTVALTDIATEGTADARYLYKAWKGAMRHGLYMEVYSRDGARRLASFSGAVEPGHEQILQFGDVWFTCAR